MLAIKHGRVRTSHWKHLKLLEARRDRSYRKEIRTSQRRIPGCQGMRIYAPAHVGIAFGVRAVGGTGQSGAPDPTVAVEASASRQPAHTPIHQPLAACSTSSVAVHRSIAGLASLFVLNKRANAHRWVILTSDVTGLACEYSRGKEKPIAVDVFLSRRASSQLLGF
jgi:hypothetical protein